MSRPSPNPTRYERRFVRETKFTSPLPTCFEGSNYAARESVLFMRQVENEHELQSQVLGYREERMLDLLEMAEHDRGDHHASTQFERDLFDELHLYGHAAFRLARYGRGRKRRKRNGR